MDPLQLGEGPPPTRIGSYRIEKRLGAGGMGVVYRAFDEALQRPLAIKHLLAEKSDPATRKRFRREAQAAARLNHPAIVHIYDIVETETGDWIAMELVEGRTLDHALGDGSLDLLQKLRLGREIAEGLAAAHTRGIIHRDLKANNVMVTLSGHAKILDFGLAKLVGGQSDPDLSRTGFILGTFHAMSPEQALGMPVDSRSDLFSLGSLLYEMFAGVSPFRGATIPETLARICNSPQKPAHEIRPDLPRQLSDLIDRLLAKTPGDRPQSAQEVVALLEIAELACRQSGLSPSLEKNLPAAEPDAADATGGATWAEPRLAYERPTRTVTGADRQRQLGERRLVTVVCCGLVGMDEASGEVSPLDLDDLSETFAAFQALVREVCERFGGLPGTSLGHLTWFCLGYPQAHGDEARQGVQAAREISAGVGGIGLRFGPGRRRRPAARIAVHTGPAIVRPSQDEPIQLGSTLDLAMGLQSTAPAGQVVVSAASRKLIAASFSVETLAPERLPGFDEPVSIYKVLEAADPRQRDNQEVTPLVGRERELELLVDRFHMARSGTGQAVLNGGEPGIGKTRLVRALQERAEGEEALWLSGFGSVYNRSSPLFPVIELLERMLFPVDRTLDRLEEVLRLHHLPLQESVPLLAALLALPTEERYPALTLGPDVQRRKTLETLVTLFSEMADRQPLVLVIEDLHWVDPSTLELLGLLLGEIASVPLMLVGTLRPEFQAPWGHRAHITQLGLSRLTDRETGDLVDRVPGASRLSEDVRRQIIARTDGVPLFVEELTKVVLESGGSGPGQDIPSTLGGSLMARLDRLGTAKEIAQVASVIGRTFSFDLLAAVSPLDPAALRQGLGELVEAELVHRRGRQGMARRERYLFKHALIQDAAYASLLKRDRQRLHLQIARELEDRLSDPEAAQPEVIARHYTAGEELDRAADFWLEAGRRASARFAHAEAIEHLQQGIKSLEGLPPGPDRDSRELALQSALSSPLAVTQGHSAPEVEAAYARILSLSGRIQIPPDVYFGLWNFYASRGELRQARELARQRLQAAEEENDMGSLFLGLYTAAAADLFLGNLEPARAGFERQLSLYPVATVEHPSNHYDIGVIALALLGDTLWIAGQPDTGLRKADEAVDLGRRISPFTLSVTLVEKMFIATSMKDAETALACARELVDLSREHSYVYWKVHYDISLALMGTPAPAVSERAEEVDKALDQAVGSVEAMRTAHGSNLQCSRFLAWIVQFCLDHGRLDRGRELLRDAWSLAEKTDERYWKADLHRLQGLLLLAEEDRERAEAEFQSALAVAREQGAGTLGLRAAGCLAKLWESQGRGEEARELLAAWEA